MSEPTDRASHWQQVYTTRPDTGVSWFEAEPRQSLAMLTAAGATSATGIVDVGGGASRLVDALLDRGYADLTVLDVSSAALAASRARLGSRAAEICWQVADITTWLPARTYDVWHDRAVFHFLTEAADRAAYLERLRAALAPGGQAIIATFAPDGPERCSGLPVMRHDAGTLAAALGPDFALAQAERDIHITPTGDEQRFQFCRFVRV